jgi:hypothetical protein
VGYALTMTISPFGIFPSFAQAPAPSGQRGTELLFQPQVPDFDFLKSRLLIPCTCRCALNRLEPDAVT